MEIAALLLIGGALILIAIELQGIRKSTEIGPELRKIRHLYTLYLKRYHPAAFVTEKVQDEEKHPIEMTPERFKELPYRNRMTATEAAIHYEKANENRVRMEQSASAK